MSTSVEPVNDANEPAPEPPPRIVLEIARVAHEANRAYAMATDNFPAQEPWNRAPAWQVDSCIDGVQFHLANPGASASATHENWMAGKLADGWVYGPVKDPAAKTHPCMVPFDQLPPEQQAKDRLFRAIVHALAAEKTPEQREIEALKKRLAEAEELMRAARGLFRTYQAHHLAKMNHEKATRNGDMANELDRFLMAPVEVADD